MKEARLDHLALDLHRADVSRREVAKQLEQSLAIVRTAQAVDTAETHQRFSDRRRRLNEHVARLHAKRAPADLSVYEVQGRLLRLPPESRTAIRWRGEALDRLDAPTAEAIKDLLREAGGFDALFLGNHPSRWCGARLDDGRIVERAIDLANRLAASLVPNLRQALTAMSRVTGLTTPAMLEEVGPRVSLLAGVAETLRCYGDAIFAADVDGLAAALAPATNGRFTSGWAWCTNSGFRAARREVQRLRRLGRAPARQLHSEIGAAAHHRRRWRALSSSGATPCVFDKLEILRTQLASAFENAAVLGDILGRDLAKLDLDAFESLLRDLLSDVDLAHQIPRVREIERQLQARGGGPILAELHSRKPEPSVWPVMFEHAWLTSCLDRARAEDATLAGFRGRTHDQFVEEFRRLDRERLALAAGRVRRAHAERVIESMNARPEQAVLVQREAAKRTRHLPLRKLVADASDVLTALRPCWMASPLSVSQLMPADRRYFDVVIFDEASQVLPEDGVPAILRGSRVVVAGDHHQLPPTPFFVSGEDEEDGDETPSPTEGLESVLDVMRTFLDPWTLDWHYRSKDETLIAFANHYVYGDTLVTFPGSGGPPAMSHILIPTTMPGQKESPTAEVEEVVGLVLQHAAERPHEKLGVIALGIKHARRVEAAVDAAAKRRPDLDAFFAEDQAERFFVKNLERVQGDERDAIILTLGAGKDLAGRLDYRQFGPLNQTGGERRLNVAITRARRRMIVVSSFDHTDMDPSRTTARGAELLRRYLEYATSGGARLGDGGLSPVPLNPFELDVYDTLSAKGIALAPQWGASRYRIDLVAKHPTRPGRFVLAIECDGASYHAVPTARDRDRLRQQHLEALGWRFHRIWSTDWFLRREEEVSRALAAFEAAVAYADRSDASGRSREIQGPRNGTDAEIAATNAAARQARAIGRRPRPSVPYRERIDDYSHGELAQLVVWIQSDGRLRTDEEIVGEMVDELGFGRRGRNIEAAIRAAIDRARREETR